MRIRFFKSLWGTADTGPSEDVLRRIRDAGYDGFEWYVTGPVPAELPELLDRHGLDWSAQIIHDTAEEMREAMRRIAPFRPLRFVVHGGRDHFSFEEGCRFFAEMLDAAGEAGIPVAHETHRYRLLYSPWVAKRYLEEFPALRLNADFSHWTCVSECLLDDSPGVMELACSRAIHIHARVGHEEGPQVSDPRAPEFARHVARFEQWWDKIRDGAARHDTDLIVVPEYGPPPYMPTLPYTRKPVADLWEICQWQTDRLRQRWNLSAKDGMQECAK